MQQENKTIWFKAKDYGWGWQPVNLQGWLVLMAYIVGDIVLVLWLSRKLEYYKVNRLHIENSDLVTFIVALMLLNFALIATCYKFGEKPRWRWGKEEIDNK